MFKRIKGYINHKIRKYIIYPRKIKRDKGKTVICNNCTGAMMLHDLGYRLDTPTVNLWMNTRDYFDFIKSLPNILFKTITDITPSNSSYPIGSLDNRITLHFLHYKSFDEAVQQWNRRAARVDLDNIYLLCVDNKDDGIDLDFKEFELLPYKHKVAITNDVSITTPSSVRLDYNPQDNKFLTSYIGWFGKRIYDNYDFKSFFSRT